MDPGVATQIIILVILLLLSAFFSSAETAFVSVNQIRMRTLSEDGNKKASLVLKITSNSAKMLSAILIGNNLVNIFASSLATTISLSIWGSKAVSIATGVLTLLVLVFGEITPKTMATVHAEKIAIVYSPVIYGLMTVLTPFIFIINKISSLVLMIFGFRADRHKEAITEDELRTLVDVGHEEGVLETDEHEMINNVFDFGDCQAKDVMIPRIDMTCVNIDSTYAEIISVFREDKYTRFPVYEGSIDNVIGIINVKDLLLSDDIEHFEVKNILRKPYFTFEFKKVSELLEELKKTSSNFAIVVDEYGSTVGMITIEDLLEEIVGEIRDEYDDDEEDPILRLSDNEFILAGNLRISELEDIPGFFTEDYSDEDYDSLGGLIIKQLERLPRAGDEVTLDGTRLVVEKCDKRRITKVHAYITPQEVKNPEE